MVIKTCFPCCFKQKDPSSPTTTRKIDVEEEVSNVENIRRYSYKDLRIATEDFRPANKIGEGGFGSVYKGKLKDGTLAAVKVLSAKSSQGVREFLSEIVAISGIEHENLVKLIGCCVEGDHRILVYGYLENLSIAQTLLGSHHSNIRFSWKIRTNICTGVAQGLSFLHEEVRPHIVHRDIKSSNILLDKDLTPKISDFGLAKLFPDHLTHITTRVAGTLGYLAPEYAIRGQLTRKADIYSFGILLLEIVTGGSITNKRLIMEEQHFLEKVWEHYERGELIQLVDKNLEADFDIEEASKYLKIGLLCTQDKPKDRPLMSTVVKMLTGEMDLDGSQISRPGVLAELMGLKTQKITTSHTLSGDSGKKGDESSSGDMSMTYCPMSFTSISERSG